MHHYFLKPFYSDQWSEVTKDEFVYAMHSEGYLFGTPAEPLSLLEEAVTQMPVFPGLLFDGKSEVTPS